MITTHRIAAGYYLVLADGADFAELVHVVTPDEGDGYGRRDYWVMHYTNGDVSDPYPTKADALADAAIAVA